MKTVFLDLEKTIIHSWDDPVIINEDMIRKHLQLIQPDLVGIYSFAIYDEQDRNVFLNTIKEEIENTFHLKIEAALIFTVQEIAKTVLKMQTEDIQKFIQTYGKQRSFLEFVKEKFPEGEFILIDDLVENLEIENIKLVNPFINKNIIN